MPKFLKIVLILGPIAIIGIVAFILFLLNKMSILAEVEFNNEKIPTLYSIVGKRKVIGYQFYLSNEEDRKTFTYKKNVVLDEDIENYIEQLEILNYTTTLKDNEVIQFAKNSSENNKVILVEIYYGDRVVIMYRKVLGSL